MIKYVYKMLSTLPEQKSKHGMKQVSKCVFDFANMYMSEIFKEGILDIW